MINDLKELNKEQLLEILQKNMEKDKHFLIKSNINLNRKVQELEKENSDYWHENDTLHKSVDYLHEQNKRYREVVTQAISDLENKCLWDALVKLKALEGESE